AMMSFSRCGVSGSSRMAPGMPMASSTAAAMVAPTAVMPLSPAPLMPSGFSGLGASSVSSTSASGVSRRPENRARASGQLRGPPPLGEQTPTQRGAPGPGGDPADVRPLTQRGLGGGAVFVADAVALARPPASLAIDPDDGDVAAVGIDLVL